MDSAIAFIIVTNHYDETVYIDFDAVESFEDDDDGSMVRTKTGREHFVKETIREIMDSFHEIGKALS